MRCDVIASGTIGSEKLIRIQKPIVILLQGTTVDQARTLIDGSGLKTILADDLEHAGEKAVAVADITVQARKIHVGVNFEGLGL